MLYTVMQILATDTTRQMVPQEIERFIPHFLNTDSAAVAIRDLDGRYLYANPGYARFAQVSAEQLVGRLHEEMSPGERAVLLRRGHEAALNRREGVRMTDDAGRHVITHFPVFDDSGKLLAIGVIAIEALGMFSEALLRAAGSESLEEVKAELQSTILALEKQATTDPLTGAWNRARLSEALDAEIYRRVRFGHPVSLALVDIDHFKVINDKYGHPLGDTVLREFTECIGSGLRASDSLTRWGGEEFIVLMPNTPLAHARLTAERLRAAVEKEGFTGIGTVTACFGVAEFSPTESAEEWIKRADEALYRAKRAGRNRVVTDNPQIDDAVAADHVETNFVELRWKKAFDSGHAEIDGQHRALFKITNELLSAVLSARPRDEIGEIVEQLLQGVTRHFAYEEGLLTEVGYPEVEAHAEEHAALSAKARQLAEAFNKGTLDVGTLFQFLAYELVARHLLGADRQFFPLIAGPAAAETGT